MARRVLQGIVVRKKADKTVTVLVERKITHAVYGKIIKIKKKYLAHDEHNKYAEGDEVKIVECRPLSKRKHWEVIEEGKTA